MNSSTHRAKPKGNTTGVPTPDLIGAIQNMLNGVWLSEA